MSISSFLSLSLVRGPGVFGEVQVYWNITPAVVSEFEAISGSVTMRDRQSAATILLKVLSNIDGSQKKIYIVEYVRADQIA